MGNWNEVLDQITQEPQVHDKLRKQFMDRLIKYTKRNAIVYYSGWLQKPQLSGIADFSISDSDMTGFMTCCSGMDKSKGLDLIIQTPGGAIAATECIIKYLRQTFNGDIRAIVPQIAMSGGTQIALSANSIVLGNYSSLGPVDPQFYGIPAQGYLEEFERAWEEIKAEPGKIAIWRPILEKISPTILTSCGHAVKWSEDILKESLTKGMFKDRDDKDRNRLLDKVIGTFGNQKNSKAHDRHIDILKAKDCGLVIEELEADRKLQDYVLSLHHLLCLTFQQTDCIKIIASSHNRAYITHYQQ